MSVRHHAAQFAEALDAYQCMTAWWSGWIPISLGSWAPADVMWRRGPDSDLAETVQWLDCEFSQEIRIGLPQHKVNAGGVTCASVLWCYVTGGDQLARARRFKPRPSLAIAEGSTSRRWLFWPLREVAGYFQIVEANRKLAYALRAVQRHGDPDAAWIPAPGTCLRNGKTRPVPVVVARLTLDDFTLEQVVGRLREPPPKDAWINGFGGS